MYKKLAKKDQHFAEYEELSLQEIIKLTQDIQMLQQSNKDLEMELFAYR